MIPQPERRPTRGRQTDVSDEELVRLAVTAPESAEAREAASELLQRYQDRVYVWCHRYVRDHERALDLAQESLLQAYRKLGSFRREARFSSWLFAVVRNKCLSAVRRLDLLVDEEAELDAMPGRMPGADQQLQEHQDEEVLLQLIQETLETREREALWLRCVERLPVDEITRLLHLDSASGARGLLQKARRKLRAALDARQREPGGA